MIKCINLANSTFNLYLLYIKLAQNKKQFMRLVLMEGEKRQYSMHTSLFLYVGNFILFCKLCHYIM